jgi:hypothetical protein
MIARSIRSGTKYGDPQWRSEMWAIRNTRLPSGRLPNLLEV